LSLEDDTLNDLLSADTSVKSGSGKHLLGMSFGGRGAFARLAGGADAGDVERNRGPIPPTEVADNGNRARAEYAKAISPSGGESWLGIGWLMMARRDGIEG
jgi:hypothetical protein